MNSVSVKVKVRERVILKFLKDPEDVSTHQVFLSREFLKQNIFETEKTKEIKGILADLYDKVQL